MKDKLTKYHHKALYYRLRSMALVLFFVVLLGGVIAIPVTIMSVAARDNPSTSQVDDAGNDESSSLLDEGLLSY